MDVSEYCPNEIKNLFNCQDCEESDCSEDGHNNEKGQRKPSFNIELKSDNDFF